MSTYEVRNLEPTDFPDLMRMEEEIFGGDGEALLGPYYVRLCTDYYNDTCFIGMRDGEPIAYLLSFVRERQVICTTLAVDPRFHRSRILPLLLRAFVSSIAHRVDECWFTVKAENEAARALHKSLGAEPAGERIDYYGPGDRRLVSRISKSRFVQLRERYERLGLVAPRTTAETVRTTVM